MFSEHGESLQNITVKEHQKLLGIEINGWLIFRHYSYSSDGQKLSVYNSTSLTFHKNLILNDVAFTSFKDAVIDNENNIWQLADDSIFKYTV